MSDVYIVADNILSPLGLTAAENFEQLKNGVSGIKEHDDKAFADNLFYAALFDPGKSFIKDTDNKYTRFEELLIASIGDALRDSGIDTADKKTALIISSTKGNISLLENEVNSPDLHKNGLHCPLQQN